MGYWEGILPCEGGEALAQPMWSLGTPADEDEMTEHDCRTHLGVCGPTHAELLTRSQTSSFSHSKQTRYLEHIFHTAAQLCLWHQHGPCCQILQCQL